MDFLDAIRLNWYFYSDSNLARIKKALDEGKDPNYKMYCGFTPLHGAVNIPIDNIEVVRELINAGADVNSRTHLDVSPLHFAVFHRKREVFDALIQSGASINAKDFLGRTSLHMAVSRFQLLPDSRIIYKLLKHKDIDYNAVNSNGETPLMVAVKNQEVLAAFQLLQNQANPNISNNVFETPLHAAFALSESYIEIKLLFCGANIYSKNKNGETPLDILLQNSLPSRPYKWMLLLLKLIAFRYNITRYLKQKFELIPRFSKFFNKCCDEVDRMRRDFLSGNITMHDFCCDCFAENDFKHLLLQIHKPVVERLVKDVYPEYFMEILDLIPKFSLFSILQMTTSSKKHAKAKGKVKDLADLLSILDVIYLFSNHLSNFEIFCLIVAFSDVKNAVSMLNFHERELFYIFY